MGFFDKFVIFSVAKFSLSNRMSSEDKSSKKGCPSFLTQEQTEVAPGWHACCTRDSSMCCINLFSEELAKAWEGTLLG